MAVVEDIELRVTVDATGAQKGLDETRKAAETMGGRVGNLTEAFKNLQAKLGPSAAAISGVASALGQTNGEAGKALAAVGQVAAAFAAGGPFGAALAAGTFAVDQLALAWERELKAQDAAIEKEYGTVSKVFDDVRKLREQNAAIERSMMPAAWRQSADRKAALDAIDAEIKKTQERRQVTRDQAQAVRNEVRALQERREELQRSFDLQDKAAARAKLDVEQEAFAAKRRDEAAENERRRQEAAARAAQAKRERDAAESKALQARIVAGMARQEAAAAPEREDRGLAMQMAFEEFDAIVEAERLAQQARTEIARKAAEDRKRIDEAEQKARVDAVTNGLGIVIGEFQGYVDARIKGEEQAEAAFVAAIMRQAGQALISYGTQAIGRGILEASSPLTAPLAAASFTAGAGLIAGGIALGGAASGITQAAATATAPQQSTSGGGTDLGARARPARPGMGGGPGGTNLTIVYGGLSGPSADDGARALGRGLERARRRGLAL